MLCTAPWARSCSASFSVSFSVSVAFSFFLLLCGRGPSAGLFWRGMGGVCGSRCVYVRADVRTSVRDSRLPRAPWGTAWWSGVVRWLFFFPCLLSCVLFVAVCCRSFGLSYASFPFLFPCSPAKPSWPSWPSAPSHSSPSSPSAPSAPSSPSSSSAPSLPSSPSPSSAPSSPSSPSPLHLLHPLKAIFLATAIADLCPRFYVWRLVGGMGWDGRGVMGCGLGVRDAGAHGHGHGDEVLGGVFCRF